MSLTALAEDTHHRGDDGGTWVMRVGTVEWLCNAHLVTIHGETYYYVGVCDCLIPCTAEERENQRTIEVLWYIRAQVGENMGS